MDVGLRARVARTALADANETRDWRGDRRHRRWRTEPVESAQDRRRRVSVAAADEGLVRVRQTRHAHRRSAWMAPHWSRR